jgi:hypothetical protein
MAVGNGLAAAVQAEAMARAEGQEQVVGLAHSLSQLFQGILRSTSAGILCQPRQCAVAQPRVPHALVLEEVMLPDIEVVPEQAVDYGRVIQDAHRIDGSQQTGISQSAADVLGKARPQEDIPVPHPNGPQGLSQLYGSPKTLCCSLRAHTLLYNRCKVTNLFSFSTYLLDKNNDRQKSFNILTVVPSIR